jgi:nucleoside-diphosphate-sugar epimerase
MRVIVTGGAGFIGSHLVDRLVQDGWGNVVILDNLFRGKRANLSRHAGNTAVRFLQTDIRDAEALREQFAGAEVVFHLAAQSNVMGAVTNIDYSFSTNVGGTLNVLKAAQSAGVRRVVFTSSREVYGEAQWLPVDESHPYHCKNPYGASKAAGEMYTRVFQHAGDLTVAVLRLANVYGVRDVGRVIPLWVERALKGQNLVVYGGQQLIDFVWVDTVVKALLRASQLEDMDDPINIGSGQGTPILELAERIIALSGSSSRLELLPARGAEVGRFTADIHRMQERLGLQPPADPLFGLPEIIAWFKTIGEETHAH